MSTLDDMARDEQRRVRLAFNLLGQPRSAYTIDQLATLGPVSRPVLYREIKSGRLVARKLRGRTIVLAADWDAYLKGLPLMQSVEPPALKRAREQRARNSASERELPKAFARQVAGDQ